MRERMSDEELLADIRVVTDRFRGARFGKSALRRIAMEAHRSREAEKRLRDVLESVKAALGDRLLGGGPLSKEYAHAVMAEIREVLR